MDISEVVPFVIAFLLVLAMSALWLLARRIPQRILRALSRFATGGAVGLLLLLCLLMLLSTTSGCNARGGKIWSSDGAYLALPTWGLQGALGADRAKVQIRRAASLNTHTVYEASGISFKDPQVQWENSRTLVVRYDPTYKQPGSSYEVHCTTQVDDVHIRCEPSLHEWRQQNPIDSEKK